MQTFLWRSSYCRGYCVVRAPSIERGWELDEGMPRLAEVQEPIICHFNSDYPQDIELSDNLFGSVAPIISQTLRDWLIPWVDDSVEFLPVKLINHRGRDVEQPFLLLHPTRVCDCLDVSASGVEWNAIDPSVICSMEGAQVLPERIPEGLHMFRLKGMGHNIVVTEQLKNSVETTDLNGLSFIELQGYTGIG